MLGRKRRELEPELVKLSGLILDLLRLALVCRDENRLPDVPQVNRNLLIERRHASTRVNDPDDGLRFVDRESGLLENVSGDDRLVVRYDAACVDELEPLGFPLDLTVYPIARDTGLIADDRLSRSGQAIEQG